MLVPLVFAAGLSVFIWKKIKLGKIKKLGIIVTLMILGFITSGLIVPKKHQQPVVPQAQTSGAPQQKTSVQQSTCEPSTKEVSPESSLPDRFAGRKGYEEIRCDDGQTSAFKLSHQLTNITAYKNGQVQTICDEKCDIAYKPYDSTNVFIAFVKPPEAGSVIRVTGVLGLPSEFTKPKPPMLGKVIFDLQAIAPKISYTNIKSILGKPTKEGIPDPLLGMDGWAEWDKEGFTLSINYDRTGGILKNSKALGCAISLFPKKGRLSEDQLRLAGNLPKGNSFIVEDKNVGVLLTFTIKPLYDINNNLYAVEVCL